MVKQKAYWRKIRSYKFTEYFGKILVRQKAQIWLDLVAESKATKQNIFTWKTTIKGNKRFKTVFAFKFKRRLGFNLNGVFNTKEQTLLEATMYVYEGGNM